MPVSSSGKNIVGTPLSREELEQIEDVFEDQNVVTYIKYKGLLFAVPLRVPGEGTCAYYELYPNEYLPTALHVVSYDGEGRMTLAYKSGDWVEITGRTNHDDEYDSLYLIKEFRDIFKQEVIDGIAENGRAVSQFEYNGKTYITYGAYAYNKDFIIFGCVVREAVAVGIDYVHLVMLGIFGLMLSILFGIG